MCNYLCFACYTKFISILLPVLMEKKNQHYCEVYIYRLSPEDVSLSRKIAIISFYKADNLFLKCRLNNWNEKMDYSTHTFQFWLELAFARLKKILIINNFLNLNTKQTLKSVFFEPRRYLSSIILIWLNYDSS